MIIDCCGCLHGHYPQLEGGDLLIVAGDLTATDSCIQHLRFQLWLHDQKYTKKIVISGNHDKRMETLGYNSIQRQYEELGEDYLCDSGTEFEYQDKIPCNFCRTRAQCVSDPLFCNSPTKKKLKIWGSPWTLTFPGINPKCTAFTGDEKLLASKFSMIPDDIDILVTHGPPKFIMDEINSGPYPENAGSVSLMNKVKDSNIKIHVFGHIHEGYGYEELAKIKNSHVFKMANCSHVNERYEPVNKPIRIIL